MESVEERPGRICFAPAGLVFSGGGYHPPLKRWAIFGRPCGTFVNPLDLGFGHRQPCETHDFGRPACLPRLQIISMHRGKHAIQPAENSFFAEHFEQVIQTRPCRLAGARQARRMHQSAGFHAELLGGLFQ